MSRDEKIDLYNWRLMSEWEKGVSVCIGPDLFIIEDLNQEQVHELNFNNQTIIRSYKFERICLTCPVCAGKGTVDWIAKATASAHRVHTLDFFRDPKGPVHYFYPEDWEGPQSEFDWFMTSTPALKLGMELCPHCHGCGLNLVKRVEPVNRYSILRC